MCQVMSFMQVAQRIFCRWAIVLCLDRIYVMNYRFLAIEIDVVSTNTSLSMAAIIEYFS
jgi:hypothetical protein